MMYPSLLTCHLFFQQLLDFLSDSDTNTAENVLVFVREAIQRYPDLKGSVVSRLIEDFNHIHSVDVHRSILWILGEYCTSVDDINRLMAELRKSLGEVGVVIIIINNNIGIRCGCGYICIVIRCGCGYICIAIRCRCGHYLL